MKIYAQPTRNLKAVNDRLAGHINRVEAYLSAFSDTNPMLLAHAPGKWSKKEIVGHLIDSALHNLRRFTEAQFSPSPYLIQSYNPDELVRRNNYGDLPIMELLQLWTSLNLQIIRVVDVLQRNQPTLYDVPIVFSSGETNTLGWLIEDYVAHMEHHLQTLID